MLNLHAAQTIYLARLVRSCAVQGRVFEPDPCGFSYIITRLRSYTEESTWRTRYGGCAEYVAILFFLVYLFFAFCFKRTGMQEEEEDFSLTCCHCQLSAEAREISKHGKPHVHCPCDKCNGRATWRMTAWRHLKSKREQSSQPTPVKKNTHNIGRARVVNSGASCGI